MISFDKLSEGITVAIPSIPPRANLLARALASVQAQSLQPVDVVVAIDSQKEGAPKTRHRAFENVTTEWTAFLDDDDEMLPFHLEKLARCAIDTGADLVWPWFTVVGGGDPFPMHFGREWNPEDPHQIPITFLAKTEAIAEAGGFADFDEYSVKPDRWGNRCGEDYMLVTRMSEQGRKLVHLPERTWLWHHDSMNTSGRPDRW